MRFKIYNIILIFINLFLIILIFLFDQSDLKTEQYNLRMQTGYDQINDEIIYLSEDEKYLVSNVMFGKSVKTFQNYLTIHFSYYEIILPDGASLLIERGQIVNKGELIYQNAHESFRAELTSRLATINYNKLIFENLEIRINFKIHFNKPYILDELEFYYFNSQKEILSLEKIEFSKQTGAYNFILSGLKIDERMFNGDELYVYLDVIEDIENYYIDQEYLYFDKMKSEYYLKKLIKTNRGTAYQKLFVDLIEIQDNHAIIEGDFNLENVFLKTD